MEAILSTIVICYIAQAVEINVRCCQIFSTLGRHTMMLFTVHALDWMWLPVLASKSWMVVSVKRVVVDLIVAGTLVVFHDLIKRQRY